MVGQFKDDSFQSHNHSISLGYEYYSNIGSYSCGANTIVGSGQSMSHSGPSATGYRGSTVTRGKRKGVKFIIKVL